jgi:hypothetical protein
MRRRTGTVCSSITFNDLRVTGRGIQPPYIAAHVQAVCCAGSGFVGSVEAGERVLRGCKDVKATFGLSSGVVESQTMISEE